jgi:hypothetical protein
MVLSLLAFAGSALGPFPGLALAGVRWKVEPDGALPAMNKAELAAAFQAAAVNARADAPARRVVVTFARPLAPAESQSLRRAGLTLLNYIGDDAYFAAIDPAELNADALAENDAVQTVRPIKRVWKQHPDTAAGIVHPWQRAGGALKPGEDESRSMIAICILLHADADLDRDGLGLVARHGGNVTTLLDDINGMVALIPASEVKGLTDEDAVMWVEPPLPPLSTLNAENRVRTQAAAVQAAPYSLNGAGVKVMVYDGGKIRTTHVDFQGRAAAGSTDTSSASDHATHVAGTIGGGGVAVAANKGMAPGVAILSYGFEQPGGLSQGFLYTDPGDLQADYTAAIGLGAVISNNSIGTNTEPNGFPCDWQGNYGVTDVLIDRIVRGTPGITNGQPFRVVWAAGNERQGNRCDVEFPPPNQDYISTAPPGCNKNAIVVGAVNSNDDSMTSFSSWGPADDGRMRPDIVAPGCQVGGDGGVTSLADTSDTAYGVKCGTSMASPTVCGISALIMQDWRTQYPSRPDMRNSTLKALLAHTAVDLGNPGPDHQTGYGSVRVKDAVDFLRTDRHREATIQATGDAYAASVQVAPGESQLKITIAWDDAPGTPNVLPTLVNDLDLVVTSPTGQQFFPWTLSASQPWLPAVRTVRNSVDNIEQVLVSNPQPGTWTVIVRGLSVPQGPQPFSIAASPTFFPCAQRGLAYFDRARYACGSQAGMTVIDCGLNTNPSAIETISLNIASTSAPAGVPVVLTETTAGSATFRGAVTLASSPGAGQLVTQHNDAISLVYVDADTGAGQSDVVTATATADCQGPDITSIAAQNVQPRSAQIAFVTDEPARATIRYGASCDALTQTATAASLATAHAISLTGLLDDTTYYYQVVADDEVGNESVATGSGAGAAACFAFTTPDTPDYLTEQFSGDNPADISNRSIYFTPNQTFQGYTACQYAITALPTNPRAGTRLTGVPDDFPGPLVTLADGASIQLFGQPHGSFYLNPNGNITFVTYDGQVQPATSLHFSTERISIFWDDLDPTQGGEIWTQQFSDRLVISYIDVPRHNGGPLSKHTFQYELFFDGRIGLHYLNMSSTFGLVGLSRGGGLPPDYAQSNFSAYLSCGSRPPSAAAQGISGPVGQGMDIALTATDDGQPANPGALRYIIKSLPAHGRLTDPSGGAITTVPHELAAGGNMVHFQPACGFSGIARFNFAANDYGTWPGGGDSNIAQIAVTVGSAAIARSYNLDTNPGWTMDNGWGYGRPTGGGGTAGGGLGSPDPTAGFTGLNVFGYNLNGNYPNSLTPERYLTSAPIDCSNLNGVTLRFQRWLGIEPSSFDRAAIQISTDGQAWSDVWVHSGPALNPNGQWTQVSYDISQWADGKPSVRLRWVQGQTDTSVVYCGWNIDDVELVAFTTPPPCIGDFNGDCSVTFGDITTVLSRFGTPFTFGDVTTVLSNFGVTCGP